MGDIYTLQLQNPENEEVLIRNLQVAGRTLSLKLTWPSHIEEQYKIIDQYFITRAQSDPLVVNHDYVRKYDFCAYYEPLIGYSEAELTQWLQQQDILPVSIRSANNTAEQLLRLQNNISTVRSILPLIHQYQDMMCWSFQLLVNDLPCVGVIRPGGWYRTSDADMQFRFISQHDVVSKTNLSTVTMEFEIGQEL